MRVAIISDIHGNLEAFKEVLSDIDSCEIDELVCLGDNIGYGPEPERVVELIRTRGIPCIVGNHELGVLGRLDPGWFNSTARDSILLTRRLVSLQTLQFLAGLPSMLHLHGALCVHGCPPDSATKYLIELPDDEMLSVFEGMQERVCFVGHTHVLEIVSSDGTAVSRGTPGEGTLVLQEDLKYIINVGSVGQPRDGDNKAKYVIWDTARGTIEVRFVAYNIAATAKKILELGFPEFYATRLW